MSQDPIGLLGSINIYQYAENTTGRVDPFGLSSSCPVHHICTNKNEISPNSGGPWTPQFKKIFDKAGFDLDDPINKIGIPGHKGPHPKEYHEEVLKRLNNATKGKSGLAYKKAFENEMGHLREDVTDPNHKLNKLLCK